MRIKSLLVWAGVSLLIGCAPNVDATKTSKGFNPPTNPNEVEILMTRPDRKFAELGTVTTAGWSPGETAKMHNALRAKSAPLGANAVIITSSGQAPTGPWGSMQVWINGVAIRYQ